MQAQFVDDPAGAVVRADSLIQSVMADRGYPMEDFEQRAADVSVDHPRVVENYRSGTSLFVRTACWRRVDRGPASGDAFLPSCSRN